MSRLLLQIYDLMQEAPRSPSILFDLEIICSDGTFLWNQFLMAAFSKTLGDVMKNQDDLFSIIVPDLSIASVKSILHNSLYPNHEDPSVLSDEDHMTFKLLTPQYDSVDLSEQLEGESNSVQEKNIFKCDFENCSAKFVRRLHLERHQSIHVKNSSFEKLCDLCGKVFYHEDYLKLHLRYHKDIEKTFSCIICQKTFKGRRAMQCHMTDYHTNKEQCTLCKKLVKRRFLPRHMKLIHPNMELEPRTKNTTKSKNQERGTLNNKSSDAVQDLIENQMKRIKCANCDKTFANSYNAKYHNERAHLKIEPTTYLSCSVCEKKFKGPPSRLARHLKEVHAENKFECSECGNFFPVKASLERHLKTVHNPTKINCPYCQVEVVHISAHLVTAHGLDSNASRSVASELFGKSAARTNIPFSSKE